MNTRRRVVFAPAQLGPNASSDAPSSSQHATYSLLSLPPALLSVLNDPATASSLEIRGYRTDAAVLVTNDHTYSLRGVQNSNSLLLCSSGANDTFGEAQTEDGRGERNNLVIHETLHETLEVIQGVARTERLEGLLKSSEYIGEDAEDTVSTQTRSAFLTFSSLQSLLPACDTAITAALRTHRVVTLKSHLRPLPPSFLLKLLPPLLSSLSPTILVTPKLEERTYDKHKAKKSKTKAVVEEKVREVVDKADLEEMLATLDSIDCGEEVARRILEWFGTPNESALDGAWKINAAEVVREIGVDLLADGGYGKQPLEQFLSKWRSLSGAFSPLCNLGLLNGTHLVDPDAGSPKILYYPLSRLSPDPATRFNELFGVKTRWEDTEMITFLDDLVGGERKKREAMVLKFVRKVKEPDGRTIWTPRNLWA